MAKKKVTLNTIGTMLQKQGREIHDLTESMSFVIKKMATKEDVLELKHELKGDILGVREQVNSIEQEHLGIKYVRLENLVEKIEEKV